MTSILVIRLLLRTASTNMGAPLVMSSCRMVPTSITCWSKTAGPGGIGSMRRGKRCSKGWSEMPERAGRGCGLTRSRCCLGVAEENPLRQPIEGKLRGVGGRGIVGRGIMDRANTGGRFGGGDAMVLCKSTLGLPISSEENF